MMIHKYRNLSKVILRKDLPRIYTMCLPNKLDDSKPLSKSLIDLDINREEVVKEVCMIMNGIWVDCLDCASYDSYPCYIVGVKCSEEASK